ncbi:DUF6338 family protein [Rhodococcus sp. CSLK01-03]|uniref:DUF6338 family protein n=1 Tax=Rhodococcus indonesiensis TaxID=3055869 RepID=A0ABT7RM18_9NOCA|nr:DUF6338 family protein [Rhodococcus indonesiensis]MDM7488689.1 DUF6338 family protein [Rhodococcus indonesiensis]
MTIPANIAVVLLLFTLVPGWLYSRLERKIRPPADTSALEELLETLAAGLGTTGVAIVLVTFVPNGWPSFVANREELVKQGSTYVRSNASAMVYTVALILIIACFIAWGIYRVRRTFHTAEYVPDGNVWIHSLGNRPKDTVPWVGVEMKDGRLVEGLLYSYTLTHKDNEERDIALAGRIRVTHKGAAPAWRDDIDRVVLPATEINLITRRLERIPVIPADDPGGEQSTARKKSISNIGRSVWDYIKACGY